MIMKKLVLTAAAAALMVSSASSYAAQCINDTWNKVMSRGKMVVGVKADQSGIRILVSLCCA